MLRKTIAYLALGLIAACVMVAPQRATTFGGGAVQLVAPQGYCIDNVASRPSDDFAVLAPCASLGVEAPFPEVYGLVTVLAGQAGSGSLAVDEIALRDFLITDDGKALLSPSGRSSDIRVISTQAFDDQVMVHFADQGEQKGLLMETNFVADAVNLPLIEAKERGAGGGHIRFQLAKCSMNSHISQFPIGTYKKCHRHGPGAHVIILSGEGYSLMWPEGEEPTRYEWEVGSMIVPPNMWYHQHFNTGTTPARYLAFKYEGVAIRNAQGVPKAWISQRIGGDQIDYADESQEVRTMFADALAKNGIAANMQSAYDAELPDLPPKR